MKTRPSHQLRTCHRSACQNYKHDEKPYKVAEAVEEQQAAPASCLLQIIPHQARAGRALEGSNHLERLLRSLPCFPAFGEQTELPLLPAIPALLCADGWTPQLQELYK